MVFSSTATESTVYRIIIVLLLQLFSSFPASAASLSSNKYYLLQNIPVSSGQRALCFQAGDPHPRNGLSQAEPYCCLKLAKTPTGNSSIPRCHSFEIEGGALSTRAFGEPVTKFAVKDSQIMAVECRDPSKSDGATSADAEKAAFGKALGRASDGAEAECPPKARKKQRGMVASEQISNDSQGCSDPSKPFQAPSPRLVKNILNKAALRQSGSGFKSRDDSPPSTDNTPPIYDPTPVDPNDPFMNATPMDTLTCDDPGQLPDFSDLSPDMQRNAAKFCKDSLAPASVLLTSFKVACDEANSVISDFNSRLDHYQQAYAPAENRQAKSREVDTQQSLQAVQDHADQLSQAYQDLQDSGSSLSDDISAATDCVDHIREFAQAFTDKQNILNSLLNGKPPECVRKAPPENPKPPSVHASFKSLQSQIIKEYKCKSGKKVLADLVSALSGVDSAAEDLTGINDALGAVADAINNDDPEALKTAQIALKNIQIETAQLINPDIQIPNCPSNLELVYTNGTLGCLPSCGSGHIHNQFGHCTTMTNGSLDDDPVLLAQQDLLDSQSALKDALVGKPAVGKHTKKNPNALTPFSNQDATATIQAAKSDEKWREKILKLVQPPSNLDYSCLTQAASDLESAQGTLKSDHAPGEDKSSKISDNQAVQDASQVLGMVMKHGDYDTAVSLVQNLRDSTDGLASAIADKNKDESSYAKTRIGDAKKAISDYIKVLKTEARPPPVVHKTVIKPLGAAKRAMPQTPPVKPPTAAPGDF